MKTEEEEKKKNEEISKEKRLYIDFYFEKAEHMMLSSLHIPKVPVPFHVEKKRSQCMLIMTAAHIFSDIWNSYNESKMLKIMEGISKIERKPN